MRRNEWGLHEPTHTRLLQRRELTFDFAISVPLLGGSGVGSWPQCMRKSVRGLSTNRTNSKSTRLSKAAEHRRTPRRCRIGYGSPKIRQVFKCAAAAAALNFPLGSWSQRMRKNEVRAFHESPIPFGIPLRMKITLSSRCRLAWVTGRFWFRVSEPDHDSDRGASLYRIMSPPFGESTRGNLTTSTGAWLGTADTQNSTSNLERSMQVIHVRCAGLDVHKRTVVSCVMISLPDGGVEKHTRTFGTMTPEILALSDWLKGYGVTHAAMESTGVYWRPIYQLLEGQFTLLVANAQHIHRMPGRKTDVKDA